MKKFIFLLLGLLFIPFSGIAQNLNGRISSSVYTFQRFDTTNVSGNYARAYQMVNLNFNKGNFSFRTYMNLQTDYENPLVSDPLLGFYNLYFEVRNIFKVATIKLGRQPIFNSVAGGVFDGLNLNLHKGNYFLTAYYGGNVPPYEKLKLIDHWNDNYILGGKFATDVVKNFQFSLSYINKNFRPDPYWATRLDAQLNPIKVLIENNSNEFKFASAAVDYDLPNTLSINTRYDYDLNFNRTSKFELDGNVYATKKLNLDFYYNFRSPLIRYNSIFSVFDYGNTQDVEVGANYILNKIFTINGRYGNVIYQDANSQRVTVGLTSNYGSFTYRKTFGYAGELDALSLYTAHSFLKGLLTPSIGLTYTKYKLSESSSANDLAALMVGVNVRPLNLFSIDLQGQYMDNKIYQNDYRFFLTLNYWFNTNF